MPTKKAQKIERTNRRWKKVTLTQLAGSTFPQRSYSTDPNKWCQKKKYMTVMLHRNPQNTYNSKHRSHIINPIYDHNLKHLNFISLLQSLNLLSKNSNGHGHNHNGRKPQFLHHSTPLQHPQGVPFLQLHSLGCSF